MQNEQGKVGSLPSAPLLPLLESFNAPLNQSYSDSEDELDEDRCYLMEIEQLKRQNNFLKKKIAELNKRHPALTPFLQKRKSLPAHIKPADSILSLPTQNYIVAFFEEVTRLLESFSHLFRLRPESYLKEQLQREQESFGVLTGNNCENLSRRLGRLLLEPQERRYGEMLSIFETYYAETQERSRALKEKVEQLTSQAIDLGKRMAENLRTREKMKSSRMMSAFHEGDSSQCEELSIMKSSHIKSTCTDSQLDLSGCKLLLQKEKFFENIF